MLLLCSCPQTVLQRIKSFEAAKTQSYSSVSVLSSQQAKPKLSFEAKIKKTMNN